jgi:hypothetical protein
VLSEKVRAFEIGREEFVEAFGGGVENIAAFAGGHAGVVDEEIDGLREAAVEFGEELAAGVGVAELALATSWAAVRLEL